eukprot:TRINITY_DN12789_c0_g1_i1.p1 TRINITY_DN12789_c0_g1~~TRINITY_DN12789_c0_g1_i1.p1  ORF type:complete len:179 (+),score=33.83 TRINITY_DN12789_c0_g1_i1:55-591(+)
MGQYDTLELVMYVVGGVLLGGVAIGCLVMQLMKAKGAPRADPMEDPEEDSDEEMKKVDPVPLLQTLPPPSPTDLRPAPPLPSSPTIFDPSTMAVSFNVAPQRSVIGGNASRSVRGFQKLSVASGDAAHNSMVGSVLASRDLKPAVADLTPKTLVASDVVSLDAKPVGKDQADEPSHDA